MILHAGYPTRKWRRVKHAGPPTSRLGSHGDVWKLANDRVAAFYYLIRNTREINKRSGGVGLLKGREGGSHSSHQNHIFHLSSWLQKHLGWKLEKIFLIKMYDIVKQLGRGCVTRKTAPFVAYVSKRELGNG